MKVLPVVSNFCGGSAHLQKTTDIIGHTGADLVRLPADPADEEVRRNQAVTQPVLWLQPEY